MPLQDYLPAELEPRNLSKKEVEYPYLVLYEFFDYAHLPEIREQLWDMLKLTVSGGYCRQNRQERANLLYFYDKLEKLVEASHVIFRQREKEILNHPPV